MVHRACCALFRFCSIAIPCCRAVFGSTRERRCKPADALQVLVLLQSVKKACVKHCLARRYLSLARALQPVIQRDLFAALVYRSVMHDGTGTNRQGNRQTPLYKPESPSLASVSVAQSARWKLRAFLNVFVFTPFTDFFFSQFCSHLQFFCVK